MFKVKYHEKAPLSSKKFLAYMFANVTTKLYLFYCTKMGEGDIVVMTAIICSVFLDVGYILGQASLDRYVRVAAIVSGQPSKEEGTPEAKSEEQPK